MRRPGRRRAKIPPELDEPLMDFANGRNLESPLRLIASGVG
jgi:hypothetical protein